MRYKYKQMYPNKMPVSVSMFYHYDHEQFSFASDLYSFDSKNIPTFDIQNYLSYSRPAGCDDDFAIFDYQNLFKKELLEKSPLVKNYSPIQEWHAYLTIERLFDLEDKTINIKLVKTGGLTPALQLIKEAQANNFKIMIGCMTESTVGISAGAVLVPLVDYVDLDGANLIGNDIAFGSTIEKGKVLLSDKVGLGISLK